MADIWRFNLKFFTQFSYILSRNTLTTQNLWLGLMCKAQEQGDGSLIKSTNFVQPTISVNIDLTRTPYEYVSNIDVEVCVDTNANIT